jgi:recombination protein RecA
MAKKKKTEETDDTTVDTEVSIKGIDDQLKEKFGDGILVTGSYITSTTQTIIPISPRLDLLTNGGIPFGSFVIPTGPPKVGKTSTSLDIAGTALGIPTKFETPRHLYYFKVEGRLQPRDLMGIHQLKQYISDDPSINRVTVVQSKFGRILHAEDFLDIAEQLINEKPGSIFIVDSMSQLCSKSRRAKDWQEDKAFRDDVPTMLSNFCKRICQVLPINESLFIGITHKIANTGFGFNPWAEASGNKVQYAVDVKLNAPFNQPWMLPGEKSITRLGLEVNWECFAAPLQNGQNITKSVSKFRFGWGIDKHDELLDISVDLGIITRKGSWYHIIGDDGNKIAVQGAPSAREALIANPIGTIKAYTKFREMLEFPTIPEGYISVCL